jgi:CheY-like chemotaxis protein
MTAIATTVRRALVVDDESSIRRVLRRYLERHGWAVDEASTGEEGTSSLLGDTEYQLVICDLNLPDCSGLDVRRAVAERDPVLAERFVMATGESSEGGGAMSTADARELASRGRLLSKPFSLDEIAQLLRRVS